LELFESLRPLAILTTCPSGHFDCHAVCCG
jgi:hypothetical protein